MKHNLCSGGKISISPLGIPRFERTGVSFFASFRGGHGNVRGGTSNDIKDLLERKKIRHNTALLKEKKGKLKDIEGTKVKLLEKLSAFKEEFLSLYDKMKGKKAGITDEEKGMLSAASEKFIGLESVAREFEKGLLSILEMGVKENERTAIRKEIERMENKGKSVEKEFTERRDNMTGMYRDEIKKIKIEIMMCEILLKNDGELTEEFINEITGAGYSLTILDIPGIADDTSAVTAEAMDVLAKSAEKFRNELEKTKGRMDSALDGQHKRYIKTIGQIEGRLEVLREALYFMIDVSDEERAVIQELKERLEGGTATRKMSFEDSEGRNLMDKLNTMREKLKAENKELKKIQKSLKGTDEKNQKNALNGIIRKCDDLKRLIESHRKREGRLERQIRENNMEVVRRILEDMETIEVRIGRVIGSVWGDGAIIKETQARYDGRVEELNERLNALDVSSMTGKKVK